MVGELSELTGVMVVVVIMYTTALSIGAAT